MEGGKKHSKRSRSPKRRSSRSRKVHVAVASPSMGMMGGSHKRKSSKKGLRRSSKSRKH